MSRLRRLADAIENGERIYAPVRAEFSIEHERTDDEEEIGFQIKWTRPQDISDSPQSRAQAGF